MVWTHVLRRLLRQRLISASVLLGVALAVALGVAVPLATNGLAELGLHSTINGIRPVLRNIQLVRVGKPFDAGFQTDIHTQLGGLVTESYTVGYTPRLRVEAEPPLQIKARLWNQEHLAEHIVLSAPSTSTTAATYRSERASCTVDAPVPVLLSVAQAQRSNLTVGDQICIAQRITVVIRDTFVPKDENDPFWYEDLRPLHGELEVSGGDETAVVAFIVADTDWANLLQRYDPTRVGFLRGLDAYTALQNTYMYRGTTTTANLTLNNLADTDRRIRAFRTAMTTSEPRPTLLTGLDQAIVVFNARFQLMQGALLLLLAEVMLLALLYVVVVGRMATERQGAELAIFRSRGGTQRQLIAGQLGQGVLLAIPGLVLGIGLGVAAVWVLGHSALFRLLAAGNPLQLRWTPTIVLLTGAIVCVALVALVLAAVPVLRASMVTLRQSRARPATSARWGTVPRDTLVVVLALVGWWQLQRTSSALTTNLDGVPQFNLLVVCAPALLLLAGALLLLRLFPFAMRLLGALWSRHNGLIGVLSTWQLARNPALYSRLVLLLTLTVGLGLYTQVLTTTINHEQLQQAVIETGADLRMPLPSGNDGIALAGPYHAVAQTRLLQQPAELFLQNGVIGEQSGGPTTVVGVDGNRLADVLRLAGSDDRPLLSALASLNGGIQSPLGAPLPTGTTALTVTVSGETSHLVVYAKLVGLNGSRQLPLGQPTATLQHLSARVPADLQAPITLQSFILLPEPGEVGNGPGGVWFGSILAQTGRTTMVVKSLAQPDAWEAQGGTDVRLAQQVGSDGVTGIRLNFNRLTPGRYAVVRPRQPMRLDVYSTVRTADHPVQIGEQLAVRTAGQRLTAVVRGIVPNWPGRPEERRNALVADQSRLIALLTYGLPSTIEPTELRLALSEQSAVLPAPTMTAKATVLRALAADPLSFGVEIMLTLGAVCAAVLSVLGVVIHAALTMRQRQLEWAVLRAIGVSTGQLVLLLFAEQSFVLLGGVVAGGLVGALLATTTQPFIAVVTKNVAGTAIVFDWAGLGLIAGGLLLALVATLGILVVGARQQGLLGALRMGEEL